MTTMTPDGSVWIGEGPDTRMVGEVLREQGQWRAVVDGSSRTETFAEREAAMAWLVEQADGE